MQSRSRLAAKSSLPGLSCCKPWVSQLPLRGSSFGRKLRSVLQQRLLKFFLDQSKKDPQKYAKFFEDFGLFLREGIVTTAEQEVKVRVEWLSGSVATWARGQV